MFESDAIGDAVPGVDYNSIILLIRWQMLVCIDLLGENGFVNLLGLFIFALLEQERISLNKHFMKVFHFAVAVGARH